MIYQGWVGDGCWRWEEEKFCSQTDEEKSDCWNQAAAAYHEWEGNIDHAKLII